MTPHRAVFRATLVVALVLMSAVCDTPRASAQEANDDAHERALILFDESSRLYDSGDFEGAAVLLRQAYAHEANAGILFNLARSLEGAGKLAEAADTYERYLSESDPDDRGAIEARVRTLRDTARRLEAAESNEVDERQIQEQEEDAAEEQARPLEAPIEPAETARSPVPWIIAGVGALAVGAGAIFGARGASLSDDAANEAQMQRAVELHESAESSALLANIFLIGGGVLAAAGLTWGIIDATKSNEPSVEARLSPAGLTVAGTF